MNKRPVLKLSPSRTDKLLNLACLLALTALWGLTIVCYIRLPETIPTHFNSKGEADDHGSRMVLFLLPLTGTLLFAGLTALVRFPHLFNYPVSINEGNARRQYALATTLMRVLKLGVLVGCMVSVLETTVAASRQQDSISAWSWIVQLTLILLPVVWYLYRAFKAK